MLLTDSQSQAMGQMCQATALDPPAAGRGRGRRTRLGEDPDGVVLRPIPGRFHTHLDQHTKRARA